MITFIKSLRLFDAETCLNIGGRFDGQLTKLRMCLEPFLFDQFRGERFLVIGDTSTMRNMSSQ